MEMRLIKKIWLLVLSADNKNKIHYLFSFERGLVIFLCES